MSYEIKFEKKALKAFNKLGDTVKTQFKKKLNKIKENPHVPANRLKNDLSGHYKIKLRKAGYRLIYTVNDEEILVTVVQVGRREKAEVYEK